MAYQSIFFGEVDSAEVEQQIVDKYTELTGRVPNPGDPEFHINATIAYARVLCLQALERAGKANLIGFATGANLDYLGALVGLVRLPISFSVTRIEFTLVSGHGQLVIPAGTKVSSTDGQGVYATDEDYLVADGIDVVNVNATCTVAGSQTNGYQAGTVTVIQNPQPYLQSATNLDVTSGGSDEETDDAFRLRWATALEALSVAGPGGAYEFHALSASPTIVSVKAIGPEDVGYNVDPGDVELRVLTDTGTPTQAILDLVKDKCDPDDVRPLCDTLYVFGAEAINYSLTVGVTAFIGSDTSTMADDVKAALEVYTNAQARSIGADIIEDALTSAGIIEGVKKLDFGVFSDIAVDFRHFAKCSAITVTIVAVEQP